MDNRFIDDDLEFIKIVNKPKSNGFSPNQKNRTVTKLKITGKPLVSLDGD